MWPPATECFFWFTQRGPRPLPPALKGPAGTMTFFQVSSDGTWAILVLGSSSRTKPGACHFRGMKPWRRRACSYSFRKLGGPWPRSGLFGTLGGPRSQNGSPTPTDIIGAATRAPVYTREGLGRIPCLPSAITQQSRPWRWGVWKRCHNHVSNHRHNHAQAVGEAVS